jgi:hypothetical protein
MRLVGSLRVARDLLDPGSPDVALLAASLVQRQKEHARPAVPRSAQPAEEFPQAGPRPLLNCAEHGVPDPSKSTRRRLKSRSRHQVFISRSRGGHLWPSMRVPSPPYVAVEPAGSLPSTQVGNLVSKSRALSADGPDGSTGPPAGRASGLPAARAAPARSSAPDNARATAA